MMKQTLKYWISILVVSLILTGCNQMPVRNPFAGRQEPKLGELPPVSAAKTKQTVKVAWSNGALGKQERFTKLVPLATAQTIFAADHTGKIVALDNQSGKKLWSSNTGKKFTAGPALMDKTLLLATSDAKVVAVDAANGHQLWEAKVSSEVLASPTGDKGIVLVHAIDGSVIALNGKTGEKLWQNEQSTPSLTLHYSSAPVIVDNLALVGFSSGKLLALNLHTGMTEWERTISLPKGRSELQRMVDISAEPIVSGDTVYVITYQGKLAAVNIPSGNLIWERDISSYQNMALDENHLFVTDNAHELWAIDRHTGATLWKQSTLATRYITGPEVVNGMVAVADRGGYVHFLSAKKGHIIDRFHLSGKIYQRPLAVGKELLINTNSGKVAVIKLSSQGSV
ncbi:MAG: outer membrane protein assembly factor BamB [Gammaproteobacteria bacterium 39-13]|nr:outer membrane protein assembly factor BamB [Gammaproteobacteria bacterium]OJV88842.1 MAG: outer membrane protein assembly factor BamB [Gammaproteobacteria bacterium 39-13]